jgi:hypothetical protein
MTVLNINLPFNLKVKVKSSHFHSDDREGFYDTYLFGLQSVSGKILTFIGTTDFGMIRSRIPINAIYHDFPNAIQYPADWLQLWDCFDYNVTAIEYSYLAEKRIHVMMKDKSWIWGTYLFTVDWYNNSYSDEPTDYKCGHVIALDNGQIACQPNNRIKVADMNWVTKDFPVAPQEFKVDQELISVESFSSRWLIEGENNYYYDYKEKT